MKALLLLLLHLCLLMLLVSKSQAATLEVITENWRPYSFLEDGEVKGRSTILVKKVLERAGIKYRITVYPWARAYKMAQSDIDVLIYSLVKVAPRLTLFKWVRPLGRGDTSSLYRLKSNTGRMPQTLQQAKKYYIVSNINSMDHLWLANQGFSKLQTPALLEQAIKMFFRKRVPLIAIDDSSMSVEFAHAGLDSTKVEKVMTLFLAVPYLAASLSTSDELIEKLQKAYDELLAEKAIELIN
ncbi:MAG: transporter substrate-binding domain-containing protein [Psychrosphaera sp.]|nr:transporter substrate-binding domain-containing protein [Psychrosphaera sp.]